VITYRVNIVKFIMQKSECNVVTKVASCGYTYDTYRYIIIKYTRAGSDFYTLGVNF
jgi:hypothetical protein